MTARLARRGRAWWRDEDGAVMMETAIAFPLLLLVALGLLQFALFYHAENVVMAAAQDGARVAAAEDRAAADGVAHAQALLRAGLGQTAEDVSVVGRDGTDAVAVEVAGRLRPILPWLGDGTLPLHARAVVHKEGFRAGPER